jgi:hypothetical protein
MHRTGFRYLAAKDLITGDTVYLGGTATGRATGASRSGSRMR